MSYQSQKVGTSGASRISTSYAPGNPIPAPAQPQMSTPPQASSAQPQSSTPPRTAKAGGVRTRAARNNVFGMAGASASAGRAAKKNQVAVRNWKKGGSWNG